MFGRISKNKRNNRDPKTSIRNLNRNLQGKLIFRKTDGIINAQKLGMKKLNKRGNRYDDFRKGHWLN